MSSETLRANAWSAGYACAHCGVEHSSAHPMCGDTRAHTPSEREANRLASRALRPWLTPTSVTRFCPAYVREASERGKQKATNLAAAPREETER